MAIFILILRIIFGVFLGYAGVMHFLKPKFFNRFIPRPLPKLIVNYVIGLIELIIGICLFFNQTVKNAALSFFILMLLFLPIHIGDLCKEKPTIGSKKLAIIRLLLHFFLLFFAYLIYIHS